MLGRFQPFNNEKIIKARSRQGQTQEFVIWSWNIFYEFRMTQGYQLDHLLSLRVLKPFCDNVVLEYGGLPHVLPLNVHLDY